MKELSGLHRKRLLVSFDDSAEVTKEREIQALTDAITDQFRGAERQLTAVGKQEGNESDSEVWREGGMEGGWEEGRAGWGYYRSVSRGREAADDGGEAGGG